MRRVLSIIAILFVSVAATAQTGVGICINPTGTEPGFAFRTGKRSVWFGEASIAKANFYSGPAVSSFITEAAIGARVVKLEKVFFNVGLGIRNEWNFGKNNKVGVTVPISIEAFPFPFQNAGVFFGAAPFYSSDLEGDIFAGIRTTGGFVFYFPKKEKTKAK